VDLGQQISVDRIVLALPPGWGTPRRDAFPSRPTATRWWLRPTTRSTRGVDNNTVTITFPATTLQTITLSVTGNTGWIAGGSFSELEVFAH